MTESVDLDSMTGRLVLVRHGESHWNAQRRFTGWSDVPLTRRGRSQASMAHHALRALLPSIDVFFCSELGRAIETTQIIARMLKTADVPVFLTRDLNERCYGSWEGLSHTPEGGTFPPDGRSLCQMWDFSPPGGESLVTLSNRVLPYLTRRVLPQVQAGKNVVLCAHANMIRVVRQFLEQGDPMLAGSLVVDHARPIAYEASGHQDGLTLVACTSVAARTPVG